jgi:transposase
LLVYTSSAQPEKKKITAEIKRGINENKNAFELRDVIIEFKKKVVLKKTLRRFLKRLNMNLNKMKTKKIKF